MHAAAYADQNTEPAGLLFHVAVLAGEGGKGQHWWTSPLSDVIAPKALLFTRGATVIVAFCADTAPGASPGVSTTCATSWCYAR